MTYRHRFAALSSILLFLAACGDDGVVTPDGGDDSGFDSGTPECGNEAPEGDEVCDDGNTTSGDGCSADCLSLERCGNAYLDDAAGEICDDGNTANGDGCSADCTSDESCGNSIVDLGVGEVCDDGNTADGDGCSADCMTGPTCGDGMANGTEVCDDGNTDDGDGCSADCSSDETCGNGTTDIGEECDDGNVDPDDGCSATCVIERCGNSLVEGTEACDDGNMVDGDGCEGDCTFSCTMDSECDDGMLCNGAETCASNVCAAGTPAADATDCGGGMVCRAGTCAMPVCGNGILEGAEACDDGNSTAGDGCENDCTFSCTMDSECDDAEACTGVETCNTTTNTCVNPADLADGTDCGGGNICNGGACVAPTCGNGTPEGAEQCDDGNTTDGDGCDNDCTFSCTMDSECDDGDACNGAETCNGSNVCVGGSAAGDGTVCDRDMMSGTRDVCLSGVCAASTCGDAYVDDAMGGTEECEDGNTTAGDGCENDCTFTCTADSDCDDGDLCNGAETCNGSNVCVAGSDATDGTTCDRGMSTVDVCIMGSCALSTCGDGYMDTMTMPPEDCDDGNLTAGDGCEPDCTITGVIGPTAFRVETLVLMHPHIYADLPIFGCRDVTNSIPLGLADPVNDILQDSVDCRVLNYITVHDPLDLAMMTNPVDLVDGECAPLPPDPSMCPGSSSPPPGTPTCQVGAGTAFPFTGTNTPAGMTCFTPDPTRYSYSAPNTVTGPCFLTSEQDITVVVSGISIPLIDARVSATYAGGAPPNQLVSGVITGFLTRTAAMAAIIPVSVSLIGGDSLYQHLADNGASGSGCNSSDDGATHTPSTGGPAVDGFWFFLNFTADEVTWTP